MVGRGIKLWVGSGGEERKMYRREECEVDEDDFLMAP